MNSDSIEAEREEQSSDNEIFFGPITLKEITKRLIPEYRRQTVGCSGNTELIDNYNSSLKLIETHSAPDVSPKSDLNSPTITKSVSSSVLSPDTLVSDWEIKPDDSFLRLEKMVADMCMSSDKPFDLSKSETIKYSFTDYSIVNNNQTNDQVEIKLSNENIDNEVTSTTEEEPNSAFKTPLKNNYTLNMPQGDIFTTQSSELKTRTPLFKTPGNPLFRKQLLTPRKYQNVSSPVAAYIKNSPQVPLTKNVCPIKYLSGASSIPKLARQIFIPKSSNKENFEHAKVNVTNPEKLENVKLPAVAYRNAKETKIIHIPDVSKKMPQNHRANQVASAIPRPMVAKHNHRVTSSAKKLLQSSQDSFDDLTLHQADLSVCTQKSALTKPK